MAPKNKREAVQMISDIRLLLDISPGGVVEEIQSQKELFRKWLHQYMPESSLANNDTDPNSNA